jgi:uncharacterized protein with beta-barrel porin domain
MSNLPARPADMIARRDSLESGRKQVQSGTLRQLLVSSSVAALLIGGGAPRALAACAITENGTSVASVTNSGAINCINIQNSTVTGNVTNTSTGTLTATGTSAPTQTGITISNASVGGAVVNAGHITTTSTSGHGIFVTNSAAVSGGISNSGSISAAGFGIVVSNVTQFGGITNSGTISVSGLFGSGIGVFSPTYAASISNSGTISAAFGIAAGNFDSFGTANSGIANSGTIAGQFAGVLVSGGTTGSGGSRGTFAGGISNSGTITSAAEGVAVVDTSQFGGGITNSGSVAATFDGVVVGGFSRVGLQFLAGVGTFAGGITNSGTISSTNANGIEVGGTFNGNANLVVSTFLGGITNSGTVTAAADGILVGGDPTGFEHSTTVSMFSGAIVNQGTITAGLNGIEVGGSPGNDSSTTVLTFVDGIVNRGLITAGRGIVVGDARGGGGVTIGTFAGGISNAGTISADLGISVGEGFAATLSTFLGGITNSGTITAPSLGAGTGIVVTHAGSFAGDIVNSASGTISGGALGIHFGNTTVGVYAVSNFSGSIRNAGTISTTRSAIEVDGVSTFSGSIVNSGAILGGNSNDAIRVLHVSTFVGAIVNSGTITGNGGGIRLSSVAVFGTASAGGSIVNSGQIVAQTGIVVGANVSTFLGAIVNSGTITGTGGTAIDISAAPNNMTIDITGGAISGNILGAGTTSGDTVNFALGSGSFAYANTITGVQAVNINSGTLFDSGTITAGGVVVNSGGTLAPGPLGTPGTLSITGNLAFNSGSNYQIQLTPTQHAFATVTGAVTISGGTVVLAPSATTLGAHYSATTFAILTSSGTLAGTFNPTVRYTGAAALSGTPTLSYDAHDAFLSYGNSIVDLATPLGANQNQQNVINGINTAILAGDTIPNGFNQLLGLSGAGYLNALSKLDGEAATDAGKGVNQLMSDFLNLMLDPTAGGGGNASGSGATGFAPEQDASLPADVALAYAKALKQQSQTPQSFERRWTAWGSAFGGTSSTDGNAAIGSNNVTASDYGFAAGMEYSAAPSITYGFGLAGGGTNWTLAQGLGSGRSDSFQAGLYAKTHAGPAYLSAALAFANHWFTTDRIALGDQLRATFIGQSYAARLEGGYRYAVPITGTIVGVTPYAALQAQDFHTPSYSETDLTGGGFGLSYASMNATDTRSELGARVDNLQAVYGMPLVLRGRLAWAHDWFTNATALNAVFQTLPGSNFTVNGAAPPKNSALTTAAAELHISANWTAIAKFDGDFGSGSQTYGGTGTLKYSW